MSTRGPRPRSGRWILSVTLAALLLDLLAPAFTSAAAVGGEVTVGSSYSDPASKAGFAAMMAYCADQTGVVPVIHTYDHAAFQDGISSYLRGTPDDVVTWSPGERMRDFAAQGLLSDLSDLWASGSWAPFSPALKALSTGYDGRQYLVPTDEYPWVVLYRKSVFSAHGYGVPATIGDLVALASRMQSDGLVPFAYGTREGWPAMGTFDILDMRMNGYAFHMDLMAGRAKWTDARVASVLREWATLLAYAQPNAATRTWQQAVDTLFSGQAGMLFTGTFAADAATDPAIRADLGAFPFPLFGNQWDAEHAIDAPVDGLVLSRIPANIAGAKALLSCAATGAAQLRFLATQGGVLATASDVDTSGYSPLQQKAAAIISSSARVAQFLDRDARSDFAGPNGMQTFVRDFVTSPDQSVEALQQRIEAFRDALPPFLAATVRVRPAPPAGTITHGTTATFAATVRPLGPTRAAVRFAVYRRVGLVSRLSFARDVIADAAGRATLRYTFGTPGTFYVVARIMPDRTYLGTAFGPPIRYVVR